MTDILRDSAAGQLLRIINRDWFPYPDELPDYQSPDYSAAIDQTDKSLESSQESQTQLGEQQDHGIRDDPNLDLEALGAVKTDTEGQMENALHRTATHGTNMLTPKKTSDGIVLVDWYTTGKQRIFRAHDLEKVDLTAPQMTRKIHKIGVQ